MILQLREHEEKEVELTPTQRDQISLALPRAIIQPVSGSNSLYKINPQNYVGLIKTADFTIEIAPKLEISRVLFLVAYALNPRYWRDQVVTYGSASSLHEAIARPFADFAERTTRKGLLHGYLPKEETLFGVKGRIRFSDQLRKHQRLATPVEVTYDEFTSDIEENQILLSAAKKLLRLQHLSSPTKQTLRRVISRLSDVTTVWYDHRSFPDPPISRLNLHYERPLALARLILGDRSIELSGKDVASNGLLFDMAVVFESFVHSALRVALNLSEKDFPKNARHHELHLDDENKVRLRPDLSWWEQQRCVMVGDVKYKKTENGLGKESDLYQLLAYTTAAEVDTGFLIYAAGESDPVTHTVSFTNKKLEVINLSLNGSPESILGEIQTLAQRISNGRDQQTRLLRSVS
jgi:5-methylcytosine-specific restriction enzyme subunit McrC